MAASERPVLKDMQNSSSESSLHLKVDETPQSSVSEVRRKCESKKDGNKYDFRRLYLCEKHDSKKDEEKKIEELNYARYPVLDEDMIAESRRALHRDYGGGTRLRFSQTCIASQGFPIFTRSTTTPQMESNFIQILCDTITQLYIRSILIVCCLLDFFSFPLCQSNRGATSRRVPNNDSPASSCHLSTDHPNQKVPMNFGGDLCKCGYLVSQQNSWTWENPGRKFHACNFYDSDTGSKGCDTFNWVDTEITEWQKDLTNKLLVDYKLHKMELTALTKELDDVYAQKECLLIENKCLKDQCKSLINEVNMKEMKNYGGSSKKEMFKRSVQIMLPVICGLLLFIVVIIVLK